MKPLLDAIATKPQKLEHAISITDAARHVVAKMTRLASPNIASRTKGMRVLQLRMRLTQNYPLARKFRYLAPFLRESSR
jgi:hypothetical protein